MAGKLSAFYRPWVAVIIFLAITAAVVDFVLGGTDLMLNGTGLSAAYLLLLISLVVHELGHASACKRFGGKPSEIGFTIYLIYPALYSDVSSSWELARGKRVVVDAAGWYLQLGLGGCYMLLYHLTHWYALRMAFFMILFTCIVSPNPLFKFYGYWLASDCLGVTNLAQQPMRLARYLWNKFRGSTERLPWSNTITGVPVVYFNRSPRIACILQMAA